MEPPFFEMVTLVLGHRKLEIEDMELGIGNNGSIRNYGHEVRNLKSKVKE